MTARDCVLCIILAQTPALLTRNVISCFAFFFSFLFWLFACLFVCLFVCLLCVAKTGKRIDYLIWIDMDLRGFDMQGVASEFPIAFRSGYDVVCANGMKYSGWYYDSYATIYDDGTWAHGVPRYQITNEIRTPPSGIYDMKSCFGGFAAYHLDFLLQSGCRYEHFGWAYAKVPEFASFADKHMLHKSCEHLPLNLCLRQNGAKIGVSTHAHSLYGTYDEHG